MAGSWCLIRREVFHVPIPQTAPALWRALHRLFHLIPQSYINLLFAGGETEAQSPRMWLTKGHTTNSWGSRFTRGPQTHAVSTPGSTRNCPHHSRPQHNLRRLSSSHPWIDLDILLAFNVFSMYFLFFSGKLFILPTINCCLSCTWAHEQLHLFRTGGAWLSTVLFKN